jgi:hypothetical protein
MGAVHPHASRHVVLFSQDDLFCFSSLGAFVNPNQDIHMNRTMAEMQLACNANAAVAAFPERTERNERNEEYIRRP